MFDYEYVGNLHIHTRHSDGAKTVPEIAEIASDAGLDFICINDHDFMRDSFDLEEEGFYGRLLVFMGLEIGKKDHHYLAYGIDRLIRSDGLGPQEVINRVNDGNGFGFMAHPFEKGMPFREKSVAYRWKDLSVTEYSGICIWNFSSRWKELVRTLFHGLLFLRFRSQVLKGPSMETIDFWDRMCQEKRVSAIGGSDAHGSEFRVGPVRFNPLPYEFLLRSINVHVFINRKIFKDFEAARHDINEALREGRLFIAHDNICPARGFQYFFVSDDGSDLMMGEEDDFSRGNLLVELPAFGEIRLIKDGKLLKSRIGTETVFRVKEKGVYRVEVYRRLRLFGWRPWIFSNPIYLR